MTNQCKHCHLPFEISSKDKEFYQKVSPIIGGKKYLLPSPSLCPPCRRQRRVSVRNFWNLYNRTCQLSGKPIISMYAPESHYTVYDVQEWWSDKWDALTYGKDIDWQKTFFQQFGKLLETVPKFAVHNVLSENCTYSNMVFGSNNCYLVFGCIENEDCLYGHILAKCKQSMDSTYSMEIEYCYECVDCNHGYNLKFCQDCEHCSDSSFLLNCRSCKNCFGCVGLQQKEYCFFNQQVNKEQYEEAIMQYTLFTDAQKQIIWQKMNELKSQMPFPAIHGYKLENCTGDYIYQSNNVRDSFDVKMSEDCRHCATTRQGKDSYDVNYTGTNHELCYEDVFTQGYHVLFSHLCLNNNQDILYCDSCFSCKNCFGCVGLRNKEYCIFNKQYSKDEYELLVPKLIEHMQKSQSEHGQEWGEFWPMKLSPFAYNESMAYTFFPLTKEEVLGLGLRWRDDHTPSKYTGTPPTIPEDIKDITDSILKEILTCKQCQKNYRIVGQELSFYRTHKLPIPKICFFCRNKNRLNARNPRKLFQRNCTKCQVALETTYSPDRPEPIMCEPCYLQTTY